jgi:flavin-dependent dehydrogenase
VKDGTRVQEILYKNEQFTIVTDREEYVVRVCCGAFGKRSNLDVKWKRPFAQQKANALNNFIAVKYHARLDHPRTKIALHNFKDGYCGIAPIENNISCICYLTTAQNLRDNANNILQMEQEVLFKNPFLKKAFADAKMLYEKPLTISQISFDKKEQVQDHVLFLGDAAGLITPLCGNGMSMALHSSKIAVPLISQFLHNKIGRNEMENRYVNEWKKMFARRLKAGRIIQDLFGRKWIMNAMVRVLRHFPRIVTMIIRETHGVIN